MKKNLIALIGLSTVVFAVENTLQGQVRLRTLASELNAAPGSKTTINHESRARLGVKSVLDKNFSALVEFQDSRRFGAEPDAVLDVPQSRLTGNSKNTDLHQAYIQITHENCEFKLGRQKVIWGSQRLLSSLEWNNQARVFDGVTMNHITPFGQIKGIASIVADRDEKSTRDLAWIAGAHYANGIDSLKFEIYGLYDQSRLPSMGFINWDLGYIGQRVSYDKGVFFEEEFIWQTGEVNENFNNLDVGAWQIATRLGYKSSFWSAILGYDVLSGDQKSSDHKMNTYLNSYSFGHQYFGWMDYILANKSDTKNDGVTDLRFDLGYKIKDSELNVEYHYFTQQSGDLAFGQEIDLQLTLKPVPKVSIPVGVGVFVPSDYGASLTRLGGNHHNTWQVYVMPTVNF